MLIADTVNQQIYEIIKAMILDRKIKPGEKIDPKLIASEHGISLMPVRNALQQLTTQGLVITKQRVGFFVRKFSNQDLDQINDTRKMFELYCIENYFDNINKSEAKQIFDRLEKASLDNDAVQQILDTRLHRMMVVASNNSFILKHYDELSCMFSLGMGLFSGGTHDVAKEEHLAILDAICKNEPKRAYKSMEEHLDRVAREIVSQNIVLGGDSE